MVVVTCGLTGWEDGRSEFSGKDMDPSNGPEHLFLLLRRYDYPVGFTSDHTWCCRWQALFAFRRLHDQFAKSRSQLFVCVNNDRKGAECHWHSISQDDMGGWKGSHDVLTSIILCWSISCFWVSFWEFDHKMIGMFRFLHEQKQSTFPIKLPM